MLTLATSGAVAKQVTAAALYAEDAQVQVLPAPRKEITDDEQTDPAADIDGPLAQWQSGGLLIRVRPGFDPLAAHVSVAGAMDSAARF